jgi:hypothetical protein
MISGLFQNSYVGPSKGLYSAPTSQIDPKPKPKRGASAIFSVTASQM